MENELKLTGSKEQVLSSVEQHLSKLGFKVASKDWSRPWGGFFVLDEAQAPAFAKKYFADTDINTLKISGKLSPKILMVDANKRLSWQ